MKQTLIITIMLVLISAPAFGQGGLIGIYIDTWGNECDIDDDAPRIIEVRIIHKETPGATAVQFMVATSPGFTGTYLGESLSSELLNGGTYIGNSMRGITIAYGTCLSSPIQVMTINFLMHGNSAQNSYLEVVDHPKPIPPGIYMTDCAVPSPNLFTAVGGRAYVNNDGSVACTTTPVESTTWGGIKALYAH